MLKLLCGLGLLTSGLAAAEEQAPRLTCSLVPGWSQTGAARSYRADNLFEYMDGNAEGYLIFGLRNMQGISCTRAGMELVIDISDMGDRDSAYGIFAANRDPRHAMDTLGMGGQIVPRRAIFAKGQYYLEIGANPEGDYTAALKEWTAALDRAVPGSSSLPEALAWFPPEKQQSLWLVPESVLGVRLLRRGYVAQYDFGKAFVVAEETAESAGTVMRKLRDRFRETTLAPVGDEAFTGNDAYLGRLCVFRIGRYVGGYANVAEGEDALRLAKTLAGRIR